MLEEYLADLESRIDESSEEVLFGDWYRFVHGKVSEGVFIPKRQPVPPSAIVWPEITVNEALDDFSAMVLQQLSSCSSLLSSDTGALMAVRANYGTPIIPSLFGVRIARMEDKLNTLPASWPLADKDAVRSLLDAGLPDLKKSLAGQALEAGERFVELFADYPKISRFVHIYHPDTQGPMDLCEMLWGSDIFYDCYEVPDLLHQLLELITETYIAYMQAWQRIVPCRNDGVAVHWGWMHQGNIMLRDDSAMNFSPEMYAEFFMPYEQRLLDIFAGGAMHFCGRGDHYVPLAANMRGLYAFNMSQPDYNDMEIIYQHSVDKGIQIIDLPRSAADAAVVNGRLLHGNVHTR